MSHKGDKRSKQPKPKIDMETGMITEEKSEGPSGKSNIYVQVSAATREIINKYKDKGQTISAIVEGAVDMYEQFYSIPPDLLALIERLKGPDTPTFQEEFGVIKDALKLRAEQKTPEKTPDIELWCKTREEMQMLLIGKTTFNQLIAAAENPESSLEKPIKKNTALDLVLWYTKKPIKELSLDDLLTAIKKIWVMANYFFLIEVIKSDQNKYHIIFKHHQNKRYSKFWSMLFQNLLQNEDLSFKCIVDGDALEESLSITIKEVHEKIPPKVDAI